MSQRSDSLPISSVGATALAALAAALGACSHSGSIHTSSRTSQPGQTPDAAQQPNDPQAVPGVELRQTTIAHTEPSAQAPARPTPFSQQSNQPSSQRNMTSTLTPLAGLTDADLGAASADPNETSENLFQATFGREGSDFDPDVSRDGKWLVFASTQHRTTSDLYLKSISGQTVTQLTNDASNDVMPSFSPDGKRVAFSSNRAGSWDVYVMGINGGQPIQVTSEPSHELHPTWSPDGRSLAFCRLNPASGKWEIWSVDVANPGVTKFLAHGLLPEWNPQNNTIAYQKPRERGERFYSVWTIQYDGGEATNPTEIAGDPEFACVSPTWSPDGERLAYAGVVNPGGPVVGGLGFQPSQSQLWMVNIDGTGKAQLTEGSFVNVMPRWGGDGRLYFVSNRAGVENIWGLTPDRAIQTASFDSKNPGHAPAQNQHGVASPSTHGAANPVPHPQHAPAAPAAHANPAKAPMSHDASNPEAEHPSETASAPPTPEGGHDEHE